MVGSGNSLLLVGEDDIITRLLQIDFKDKVILVGSAFAKLVTDRFATALEAVDDAELAGRQALDLEGQLVAGALGHDRLRDGVGPTYLAVAAFHRDRLVPFGG